MTALHDVAVDAGAKVVELASRVRGERAVHADGLLVEARLTVTPAGPATGAPLLDTADEHAALVRFSRAVGLPDRLPDVYGLSTVALRLGNVYGPRQDPLGEAGVIAIFCGALKEDRRPTIFGDGTQTRDYIYVGDVVAAALAAADSSATGPINIGTGRETSVLDLVEALRSQGGNDAFEADFAPPRTGEVQRITLDASRAEGELGWRAEVGLEDGLARSLASI